MRILIYLLSLSSQEDENTVSTTQSPDLLENCNGWHTHIGNGICDQSLNSEQCLFDGGDCCQDVSSETCTSAALEAIAPKEAVDPEPDCQCGRILQQSSNIDNKIIGGSPARKESIPWQVGIASSLNQNPICGGTVIGPKTVLSAAHCFYGYANPIDYVIFVGVTDANDLEQRLKGTFYIETLKIHPLYDPDEQMFDFAILTLTQPIHFSEKGPFINHVFSLGVQK